MAIYFVQYNKNIAVIGESARDSLLARSEYNLLGVIAYGLPHPTSMTMPIYAYYAKDASSGKIVGGFLSLNDDMAGDDFTCTGGSTRGRVIVPQEINQVYLKTSMSDAESTPGYCSFSSTGMLPFRAYCCCLLDS